MYELEVHLSLKNYSYLNSLKDHPNVVANFLKKLLQELSEPLIPYANYPDFRDLPLPGSDPLSSPRQLLDNKLTMITEENIDSDLSPPIERKNARIAEIHNLCDQLHPRNRNTLQYLCKFF